MDHMESKSQNFEFSKDLNLKSDRSSNCFVITSRSAGDYSLRFNNERMASTYHLPNNTGNKPLPCTEDVHFEVPSSEFYNDELRRGEVPAETTMEPVLNGLLGESDDDVEEDISISQDYNVNKRRRMSCKLRSELVKYKEELRHYKDTTEELENKYKKINHELCEMQEKHNRFMKQHHEESSPSFIEDGDTYSENTTDSDISLQRKSTQIFHRGSSFMQVVPQERYVRPYGNFEEISRNYKGVRSQRENKENQGVLNYLGKKRDEDSSAISSRNTNYLTPPSHMAVAPVELLQNTIDTLQTEQQQFRSIIEQQQNCLQDYHSRCLRAQRVMKTQQIQIEKLNTNNRHLEAEISHGFEHLRNKIETKLRELAQLPQLMKEEKTKSERISRDNSLLNERIRSIQIEASQMKKKIEDISKRKLATMTRLKAAERDLKIFRNYNSALKHEKRKLNEELLKLRDQMQILENSNKRSITRQREQSEKQKRDLQRRIYELELKLNRSQTSASSLVKERDALIAELQTQLNNLVHNFEVSQKHIRILRRHIYNMTGSNSRDAVARNRILEETS